MDSAPPLASRPRRGDQLELSVDSVAFGGAGVARLDGYVVFVAGAIPGDTVRAVVGKTRRGYAEARAIEILRPSPERLDPLADHPGAPWQVLPYERQLQIKQEQVDDALRRLGHLDGYELEPILASTQPWRYRNKLEYSFGTDPAGRLVCGFHVPGRWDEIVEVADCLLASERSNQAREEVVQWCRTAGLEAFDRRSQRGFLRNLVVREGRRTGDLQVRLVTAPAAPRRAGLRGLAPAGAPDRPGALAPPGALPSASGANLDAEALIAAARSAQGLLWTQLDSPAEITSGGRTELLSGSDRLEEEIGGLRVRISDQAFFQTNTEMAERLYAIANEYAELTGFERVYDLYCGIGTIGLLMSPRAAELWGLEIVEDAIADAIANARANEIDNARFFAGDVRLALAELVERAGRPEVLVVDPPRAGLSQKIVRRIIEAAPRRIVYVSCNPTTLAPNAAQLGEAGYALRKVRPVDMFPQTPHVECVAQFERRPQPVRPPAPDLATAGQPPAADDAGPDLTAPRRHSRQTGD